MSKEYRSGMFYYMRCVMQVVLVGAFWSVACLYGQEQTEDNRSDRTARIGVIAKTNLVGKLRAWIVVEDAEGKLHVKVTNFKTPLLFNQLPPGKASVRLVPQPVSCAVAEKVKLPTGSSVIEAKSGQMVMARLPIKAVDPAKVTVRFDSSYKQESLGVTVCDVTNKEKWASIRMAGSVDSPVEFYGMPGRKYQLFTGSNVPLPHPMISPVFSLADKDTEHLWQKDNNRFFEFRFVCKQGDKTVPAVYMDRAIIQGDKRSISTVVREGVAYVDLKESAYSSSKTLTVKHVDLSSREDVKYTILKNKVIPITADMKMKADVLVSPIKRRGVVVLVTDMEGMRYKEAYSYLKTPTGFMPVQPFVDIDLPPGKYSFMAWSDRGSVEEKSIVVKEEGYVPLVFKLKPLSKMTVEIVNNSDLPLKNYSVHATYAGYHLVRHTLTPKEGGICMGYIDMGLKYSLILRTDTHGLMPVKADAAGKATKVFIEKPLTFSGTVKVAKGVVGISRPMALAFCPVGYPGIIACKALLKQDGFTSGKMQPGKYNVFVVTAGPEFKVINTGMATITRAGRKKSFIITEAMAKSAVSLKKSGLD